MTSPFYTIERKAIVIEVTLLFTLLSSLHADLPSMPLQSPRTLLFILPVGVIVECNYSTGSNAVVCTRMHDVYSYDYGTGRFLNYI